MARCEDYPCCGHELGCCPDFDASGRQMNMVCTCGAKLPINSRYSICNTCLKDDYNPMDYMDGGEWDDGSFDDEEENYPDDYEDEFGRY